MSFFKQTKPFQPPNGHNPASPRPPDITYVYQLTAFVSLGTMLFGYDQGIMGVIVADDRWVSLMQPANSWVTGAVISLYDIGCFVGAMSVGILADSCGRERTLSFSSVVFIIGAILQCASYSITQIIIGRVVLGYGVGACAAGVPLYVTEIAPATIRGRIIGITQMILCTGELFAFWLNYGFAYLDTNDWWRIPLAIQILPAVVLGVGCWVWVPPSPRWLVQQDRHACAREILARLHGDVDAELEMAQIAERFDLERTPAGSSWLDMFRWPLLKVTLLGMGVQFFQQSTGTNSILYYTVCSPIHCRQVSLDTDRQHQPSLFLRGGIEDAHTRNLATGGVGIILFVFSWIPIFVFDRLGRKTWLQIGTVGMMCAMIGISVLQWHAENNPGSPGNYAIIAFPYLFYMFFNISWGVGSWTYASEIFPLTYRAKGNALSTMSLWLTCYVVAQVSPPINEAIGWGLYIIYAGICVVALAFVTFAMVETRGRTLEEMSRLFNIDFRTTQVDSADVKDGEVAEKREFAQE
jgi:MFS family permease